MVHCFGGLSNRIGHDSFDGDAEASVIGEDGFQVGDGAVAHRPLCCFWSGKRSVQAMREASSMQTCRYSQLTPRVLD